MNKGNIKRRPTHQVSVGKLKIGGENPVVIQTMTNTSTLDTDATVDQIIRCVEAGAPLVRMTAQGVAHAANLGRIHQALDRKGIDVELVADIHFNPAAAFEAAKHVEKVRINPGNFVDPGRVFKQIEYSDAEYADELNRLEEKVTEFYRLCMERGTAVRIGVNHGSLSDRIMSRYGDTPHGMVESAMEFLRIARKCGFKDIVVSIKASNVLVMTTTVRLLARAMEEEGMTFPLHLGVTEAGDGEDGRVKSAVGIGSLLAEGLGDTIRVSLSEAPEAEIPVAREILSHIGRLDAGADYVTRRGDILVATYPADWDIDRVTVAASIDLGRILITDEPVRDIEIVAPGIEDERLQNLALSILQATRRRITKTEFIACPGCGRTLFDLPDTLAQVRRAMGHLKGLKIGVMGCIVNGPGEMADADYGYVGGAQGRVSVYRGKECVYRNLEPAAALEALVELIKADGRWVEPDTKS